MTMTYQNVDVCQPQIENFWLVISDSGRGNLAMRWDVVFFLPIGRSGVL
jgi:hypothetical protein